MKYQLRDYQQRACRRVADCMTGPIDGGVGPFERVLLSAATGSGKTIMASALIWWAVKKMGWRCLFLADTNELVAQAVDKIIESAGLVPSIEKAQSRGSRDAGVVVGSIHTMARPDRLATWDAGHFGLVIADEAHLSLADGWQRVLGHFGNGGANTLGITATPARGDGKKLLNFYQHLADDIGLYDLIERGHLAPITVEVCPVEVDCTHVRTKAGDYREDDLQEAIEPYYDAIIDQWQRAASDRPTMIFHPSIMASQKFTQMMRARGINARHVDGAAKDREETVASFHAGRFDVLNNAMLLSKGFDCPRVSCIINLRLTKSRTLYQQIIGRGTRCDTGKADLLVLDFLWQFKGLGVMGPAALVASGKDAEVALKQVLDRSGRVNLGAAKVMAEREREQAVIKALRQAKRRTKHHRYDARTLGAVLHQPELMDYTPGERGQWETMPPTDKQAELLRKWKINDSRIKTRGEASAIIGALVDRSQADKATIAQVGLLLKLGHADPAALSFADAKTEIDQRLQKTYCANR
jgi:superfamily II DNA or RNA helicase